MKKVGKLIIKLLLHICAAGAIVYFFWPLAKWYFENRFLWGVDFYYTASLVNIIRNNPVLTPGAWNYQWFSGWALLSNYPILQYYLILPFTGFFSLITAVKVWMLISLVIFFIGCYACFYLLSRSFAISFVLTLASIYSAGTYGTLMWGGSLPSHATQAFVPWVIFFIIYFLKKYSKRAFAAAILLTGLAVYGHPQNVIVYIYPMAGMLFLFWVGGKKLADRLKFFIIYFVLSLLIAIPQLYTSGGGALSSLVITDAQVTAASTGPVSASTRAGIEAFNRSQPIRIISDTNNSVFIILAFAAIWFAVSFLYRRKLKMIALLIPWIIVDIFYVVYIILFGYGISIFHGGWYRLFWATTLWMGLLASAMWGVANQYANEKLKHFTIKFSGMVLSVVIVVTGGLLVFHYSQNLKEFIVKRSQASSAFPDVLNIWTEGSDTEKLKSSLIPSWIDPNNTNYRIYAADQTFNIWWNAWYKMPLGRGYLDPPVTLQNRGYFFLLDTSLSQNRNTHKEQLVETFHYPPEAAMNTRLFFLDWYGIKYIQAGASKATDSPLPETFAGKDFFKNQESLDFTNYRIDQSDEHTQVLNYFELQDNLTSPILSPTKAKTVGIISSDYGYETVMRVMSEINIQSRSLIPVKLGNKIDGLSDKDLSAMDALIVYDYTYDNKSAAFSLLNKFLDQGKKIFIDTGTEIKDANNASLADIFPMDSLERKPLKSEWDISAEGSNLTDDIDFSSFDPPVFDNSPWSFSYPTESSTLREGSKVALRNFGKPILMTYKDQHVIWSGMNLPYHIIRQHNSEEAKFFKNILLSIMALNDEDLPKSTVNFVDNQNRTVSFSEGSGVLFKEQDYPGWRATIKTDSGSQSLKIYKAGPAYPGFMYVRIPEETAGKEATVSFSYGGNPVMWMLCVMSFVIGIFLLDEIVLNGGILGKFKKRTWKKIKVKVSAWWSREDE